MDTTVQIWISLALDDLASSQLLYAEGRPRASYFLFQQASEKANKAFAIYSGELKDDEVLSIGHNQLKPYRSSLVRQQADTKQLVDALHCYPHINTHPILNLSKLSSHKINLQKGISFIDGLKDRDMVNIPLSDLNYLIKELKKLEKTKIKFPKKINDELKTYWMELSHWIGGFGTAEAVAAQHELLSILNTNEGTTELNTVVLQMIKLCIDSIFVQYTLYCCALITAQHAVLSRYPVDKKDPLLIYTLKLPVIKKQPAFMYLLENAIDKLTNLYTYENAKHE